MGQAHNKVTKGTLERLQSADAVLAREFPPDHLFRSFRGTEPAAQLRQAIDLVFASCRKVQRAQNELAKALLERTDQLRKGEKLAAGLKVLLTNALGAGHPALKAPGLRQHGGRRLLTAEQKFLKAEKAKRTYQLQGRLTKAQKKERRFRGKLVATAVPKKGK